MAKIHPSSALKDQTYLRKFYIINTQQLAMFFHHDFEGYKSSTLNLPFILYFQTYHS
jgi:hypothetical protein